MYVIKTRVTVLRKQKSSDFFLQESDGEDEISMTQVVVDLFNEILCISSEELMCESATAYENKRKIREEDNSMDVPEDDGSYLYNVVPEVGSHSEQRKAQNMMAEGQETAKENIKELSGSYHIPRAQADEQKDKIEASCFDITSLGYDDPTEILKKEPSERDKRNDEDAEQKQEALSEDKIAAPSFEVQDSQTQVEKDLPRQASFLEEADCISEYLDDITITEAIKTYHMNKKDDTSPTRETRERENQTERRAINKQPKGQVKQQKKKMKFWDKAWVQALEEKFALTLSSVEKLRKRRKRDHPLALVNLVRRLAVYEMRVERREGRRAHFYSFLFGIRLM